VSGRTVYTYVGNDPLDHTDPNGKSIDDVLNAVDDFFLSNPEFGGPLFSLAGHELGAGFRALGGLFRGAEVAEATKGVNITLKAKEGWSVAQKAEAVEKTNSLDSLAKEGKLAVTKSPERAATSASERYKQAGGEVSKGQDVDHTHDLQLGGKDATNNMKPLDSSVNRSLGAQVQQQTRDLPAGTKICGVAIDCQ